jgi:hypothetical protein
VAQFLSQLPETVVLGALLVLLVLVLFVPISLRVAGLTGQQIKDVLQQTMQFFVSLVHEFRAQNRQPPSQ